ncbi:MAG: ABC transporter ATP-binding protein [Candidatus Portnoybacteria bacterium]|nr:ABC transporter ATP-binding protein [Candidatus Portnoybacteria bacterium]MDD4983025.1 ABC transporter ATP-binding protein [Candidatus Portnoybacteria bacterium]
MKDKNSNIKYPPVRLKDVAGYVWYGIKSSKLAMFLTIAGIAGASVFEIITPLYFKRFFDLLAFVPDKNIVAAQLIDILLMILFLNVCAWVFWRVGSFANVFFQAKSMAVLRRQAYGYLIHHSYNFFANNFSGALVQRVGRYARAFERLADRITWNLVPLIVRLTGIAIITMSIEQRLTILIIGWAALYIVVNYFYSLWKLKYSIKAAEADSRTTAVLADTIANQNNIEIFSRHQSEKDNFKEVTEEQRKITAFNWNTDLGMDGIQAALIFIIEFIILYFTVRYWQVGVVTIGTFVLVQMYVIGLGMRLWEFSRIVRDFYEGYADMKEMVEIMKLPYDIKNAPGAKPLEVSAGEVVFNDVNFYFNDGREVLKGVNLKIKAGEKIALVGPSGSGKTTLVRLLLRFYDAISGNILIDGQDIKKVTLESLRNNISLVPQDPILFHRTIMANIRYGRQSAADEEVIKAARLAYCDEFIDNLPKKYETHVGERGIKLSGGERQRVAIARAILKNAPILILDEATSSLDSRSEALIQDALDVLMKGKTVIVIAHRLSTIRKMDRIVVLEKGIIKESGSHKELIAKDTLYKKLWALQAGGFIRNGNGQEE